MSHKIFIVRRIDNLLLSEKYLHLNHVESQLLRYITTNPGKTVLYIGVTNDIRVRVLQHLESKGTNKSFTGKYYCYHLVYYEHFTHIEHAIAREKEIKKWRREKKVALIESTNPTWTFLNDCVIE